MTSAHLTQRLSQAILLLNKMSYQARWEARAQAPSIIFSHCPYLAILAANPELCQLDAVLLQQLLASPVDQTARLVLDQRGLRQCIFQVRK
jgi:predicted ArsR family transcriptional regulator